MICKYIYSDKARQGRKRGNKIAPISHIWIRFLKFLFGLCTVTITCLPYLLVNCVCDDFLLLLLCFNLDLLQWLVLIAFMLYLVPFIVIESIFIELSSFGAVMMV
eukprot:444746_1